MKSPIKYAGGKAQLLPVLLPLVPRSYGTYYEPFLGGGTMLLNVMPEHAVVGDVNFPLMTMWSALRDDWESVACRLDGMQSSYNGVDSDAQKIRYYEFRDEFNAYLTRKVADESWAPSIDERTSIAALMIATNKLAFNGLFRIRPVRTTCHDGVTEKVGGYFNVPHNKLRKVRMYDEDNLCEIGTYLSSNDIDIRTSSYGDTLSSVSRGDLVFADPPYVPERNGSFVGYSNGGFPKREHEDVAKLLSKLADAGVSVIATNSSTDETRRLYGGSFDMRCVPVRRNINRSGDKRAGHELVMTSKR